MSDPELKMTIESLARRGVPERQIARQLALSEGAVRHHLKRIEAPPPDGRARRRRLAVDIAEHPRGTDTRVLIRPRAPRGRSDGEPRPADAARTARGGARAAGGTAAGAPFGRPLRRHRLGVRPMSAVTTASVAARSPPTSKSAARRTPDIERTRERLAALGPAHVADALEAVLTNAIREGTTARDFLDALLGAEAEEREAHRVGHLAEAVEPVDRADPR